VFWLGLFPEGPMQKTEQAAKQYRELVMTERVPGVAR